MQATGEISLWDGSAEEEDLDRPLDGDQVADVAIVGGGFTGLSTALHAALDGMSCHVLEAERIGFGGSGRNVGLVNAGVWLPPQVVRERLGEAQAGTLLRILGEAPAYVFSLIEKYQIRCEATRSGTIHAAHSARGYEDLARRAEGWHALGAPVDLLSREAARVKIGSDGFCGGLLDRRAGTLNPMGYVRGLARAAESAGARISTGVRVLALKRTGDRWQLGTSKGTVTARQVVLATNAYTDALWPGLSSTFTPIHFFQVATEPLGARAGAILPERQGLWDTAKVMFSLRRDASGRLIIGSMGAVSGGLSARWAKRRLAQLFPDLGPVALESAWHGRIAMTPDHFPRIHRLAENLYTPIGYNGRGITTGTIFGRAMSEVLTGQSGSQLPVPFSDPRPVRGRSAMAAFYTAAFAANQLMRSL